MSETVKKQGMGLYVHIPFCLSRCHYCSFASTAGLDRSWQERYKQGLLREWQLYRQNRGLGSCAGGRGASGERPAVEPRLWQQALLGEQTGQENGNWSTIYFGGGTPTYLAEDILAEIFAGLLGAPTEAPPPSVPSALPTPAVAAAGQTGGLKELFITEETFREFTVEANPGTLNEGKLALLQKAGCNRLSIGAQSFDDQYLAWLGRGHRAADFRQAWELGRQAGFRNMSLDLIYGLPGQTLAHWRQTLEQALTFAPEHISLYQLNIEEETVLSRRAAAGEFCVADEETCRQQYLLAHELLTSAGFGHYEISNYALPGKESRHNSLYWRNGYYLGLGAGAAGYLPAPAAEATDATEVTEATRAGSQTIAPEAGTCTSTRASVGVAASIEASAGVGAGVGAATNQSGRGFRYTNTGDLASYLAAIEQGRLPLAEREEITPTLGRQEELMLAFRLKQGIDPSEFRQRWGLDLWQAYGPVLEKHLAAGWLQEEGGRLCPTIEGWLAYNYWVQEYLL